MRYCKFYREVRKLHFTRLEAFLMVIAMMLSNYATRHHSYAAKVIHEREFSD
jgi:hypothetical protein